jgi:DNA-3-methyladenine glycosylase
MQILTQDFFARDTVTVARELLGKHLVRTLPDGQSVTVTITETEAYVGPIDKACHAYGYKRTPRTQTMFSAPGTAYIYLIYGMYHCLNLVTEAEGEPCAVLLRGAVPTENVDIIAENRFGCKYEQMTAYQRKNFLNGPGKVCQGLSLSTSQNGISLLGDELFVCDSLSDLGLSPFPGDELPLHIKTGKRIGIEYAEECADYLWRFYL